MLLGATWAELSGITVG